jgi:hypothetical protein
MAIREKPDFPMILPSIKILYLRTHVTDLNNALL